MQQRKLGNLEVSALGLGCMGLTFGYGPATDRREAIALIRAAVERGFTFFDTAEVYGPLYERRARRRSARAVQGAGRHRDEVRCRHRARQDAARLEQPARARQGSRRRVAEAASSRCDRSVLSAPRRSERADRGRRRRRQGADPAGQGQALRLVGSRCRDDSPRARRSAAWPPCRASTRCGIRALEREVLPTLEELGIGLVPFGPLGKGYLTGTIDEHTPFAAGDFRNMMPRFAPEARKANRALVEVLARLAVRLASHAGAARARRGCWRASRGSCRSPARASSSASTRTPARRPSSSRAADLADIEEAAGQGRRFRCALTRAVREPHGALRLSRNIGTGAADRNACRISTKSMVLYISNLGETVMKKLALAAIGAAYLCGTAMAQDARTTITNAQTRVRQRSIRHVLGIGARRRVPAVRRERDRADLLRHARSDAADHELRSRHRPRGADVAPHGHHAEPRCRRLDDDHSGNVLPAGHGAASGRHRAWASVARALHHAVGLPEGRRRQQRDGRAPRRRSPCSAGARA